VYINKNQVLKEATAQDIANYLFNNNFSINYKKGIVTDDSCSIRAETGKLYLNEVYFNNNTKLNFYSSAKLENGQGEITSQKGRKYVSYKFKVSKVLENSNNSLVLIITDKRTKKNSTLEFNKLTNKIIINGVDKIEDLKISFVSGCQNELKNYYLLGDSPTSKKTIEQVRALLNENPILIKNHESLKKLYHDFWFVEVLFGI
jgi:hypothetical protein